MKMTTSCVAARLKLRLSVGACMLLLATISCSDSAGTVAAGPVGSTSTPGPADTCGDGVCSLADAETCEVCSADCGACGTCGDGTCDVGVETCEDCPSDCGACAVCGDDTCDEPAGEDCSTCIEDCGACPGCGDGVCDADSVETCASCAEDCGACELCGDGACDAAEGEDCSSCAEDCGACDPCGDGECAANEDCTSCPADCECTTRPGCVQGSFKVYWGNLHAHTHYSDGESVPGTAFAHARGAGLDFMWITDHREMMTSTEWSSCRHQADAANEPDKFVAGCGYEYNIFSTSGDKRGHMNVLFTGTLMAKPTGLGPLYEKLAGCSPCVGQYNHPPWPGTFLDYKYYAAGLNAMRLMELSGHGEWDKKWASYFTALRNGWLISPTSNEDNHSKNWGDSHRASGVWATALSRTAIRQAVRAHRTFAAFDDTASIKMLADDVCFQGSVLHGFGPTEIKVVARDKQTNDTFKRIDLYGRNGQVLDTYACNKDNPCIATFSRKVTQATFFVAKATQTDGDALVSGPIWFEP